VINVVVAGLAARACSRRPESWRHGLSRGLDVKKSEIHGMSQRGGSVSSDVRFGDSVFSPMVPAGEADFLVVLAASQIEVRGRRSRRTES